MELIEADPNWPRLFDEEKTVLLAALGGEDVLAIEHFGSTAIAALAAKPIIDILIAVPSVATAKSRFVSKLRPHGYVFWHDNPKRDRLFFVKGMPPFGNKTPTSIRIWWWRCKATSNTPRSPSWPPERPASK